MFQKQSVPSYIPVMKQSTTHSVLRRLQRSECEDRDVYVVLWCPGEFFASDCDKAGR